ncbi:MAG: prolipoprotein diacylglyceryl transferase [Treponema sp.]|jgi:phosphatidylglycerol:prolipoprotein diacylglycerol transferase|nr:prolipoprotein diacylglyceryl transferase [Treponema sp.]
MLLAIPFPSWLKPEVIPGLPVRWYGVMYIVAFGVAYFLYRRQVRERRFPMSDDELSGMFVYCIVCLLLGARIFSTLVYETDDYYRRQPWLIFWPFRDGRFTGLMGMSYHGGAIGGTFGIISYALYKRFDPREIGDMYAGSIPLGYTFGRLGNFINGELYGRATASPLGMIFPQATAYPAQEGWVQDIAAKAGISINNPQGLVNLPRHPSQLYEALFEGVLAWALTWVIRNKKPYKGFLFGIYFVIYGIMRVFVEYFREPDAHLGYRVEFVKSVLPPAAAHPLFSFSTGQLLSFLEIFLALLWLVIAARLPDREPIRVYQEISAGDSSGNASRGDARKEAKKARRKLRRKLR